jgi:Ca2+-binding EF-hand superfamily protein
MSTVEVPANSNAAVVKKRVRKRKTGGGGKANAIHPDRHKKLEDSELRVSRKLNKYKADGSLVVDNSETLARQAALKAKLAADVAARQAGIRAKAVAKEQELLRVGARMAGRRRGALAAWRERRRRNSIIAMSEASAAEAAIDRLDLTQRDLRKLKMMFEEIDVDRAGSVDPEEFFAMLNDDGGGVRQTLQSPLTDRLFRLIDLDGSGTLEFEEFVHLCGTYAVHSRLEIARFCFDTFDVHGQGFLDEGGFLRLLSGLEQKTPAFPGNFKMALAEFDSNGDGNIDWQEFRALFEKYFSVFYPAFLLQDRIHECTLGHKRWVQILERHSRKMAAADWILQHNGGLPPTQLGCWGSLVALVCCSRHPAEVLLNIDSRPTGFADEPDTAEKRRYAQCGLKFGFQQVQNRSREAKPKVGPKKLGYEAWRAQAGSRASLRKVKAAGTAVGAASYMQRQSQR